MPFQRLGHVIALIVIASGASACKSTHAQSSQALANTPAASTPCVGVRLTVGNALSTNEALCSPSGEFQALLQSDGNLVVSQRRTDDVVWDSGTSNPQALGAYSLLMQDDCNLVLYAKASGKPIWASDMMLTFKNCAVQMQDDGNLVVLGGPSQSPIWSTRTGDARTKVDGFAIGDPVLVYFAGWKFGELLEAGGGSFKTTASNYSYIDTKLLEHYQRQQTLDGFSIGEAVMVDYAGLHKGRIVDIANGRFLTTEAPWYLPGEKLRKLP